MATIKGLGRISFYSDSDSEHLIKPLLPEGPPARNYQYWNPPNTFFGDLGTAPYAVGYAWASWFAAKGPDFFPAPSPIMPAKILYLEAQKIDKEDGVDYEGTTVRAGAKVLVNHGKLTDYKLGWDIDTLIQTILKLSPVVLGVNWYDGMSVPDGNGLISIYGDLIGGNAVLADAADLPANVIRIKGNWGKDWGVDGYAYINIQDAAKLLYDNGEFAIGVRD